MITFHYTINDPLGIHARPAGMLARLAKDYADHTVTVTRGEDTVRVNQMMKLMSLAIKQGDAVTVTVEGSDPAVEKEAADAFRRFFEQNL